MLSILIASSLFGALITGIIRNSKLVKIVSFLISIVIFISSLLMLSNFETIGGGFQFIEKFSLVPAFGISYHLGIDGISIWLILLTTFLTPLVILGSFKTITVNVPGYYALVLLLEGAIVGVFCALDLFLFFIFWDLILIPMFFIIGIWGGKNKIYAAISFVIFTMIGSLLMLVAIIYLANFGGSFDYTELINIKIPVEIQYWLFAAFALAFLIKVPVFPFHTWLPNAHTEAPAGGSVILAGLMLKVGIYGFIRLNIPLFPEAAKFFAPTLMIMGLIGIIHGAFAAAAQTDIKRLVAYSSVSHMGFMVLGIFSFTPQGIEGAVLQMLNHGLSTGALFFLIGMIYDQTHTREIADYGGIADRVPRFAVVFLFTVLASAGLPGLNGFIGEFMILASTFRVDPLIGSLAVSGIVLGAWYLLRLYGLIFFGPDKKDNHTEKLQDISFREGMVMLPLIVFMILIGIAPGIFLKSMKDSVYNNVIMPMTQYAVKPLNEQVNVFVPAKVE